jgi:TPR repeat protein
MEDGKERGRLGVGIRGMDSDELAVFGSAVRAGVLITMIAADAPAAGSGLRPLDLVTEIDGVVADDDARFRKLVGERRPGQVVELRLLRLGSSTTEILDGLHRLADGPNTAAQVWLASLYQRGDIVNQDSTQALRYYRKGAEAGNVRAMMNMGWMYRLGGATITNDGMQGAIKKDGPEAAHWFRRAAELGHTPGMLALGSMLENGDGIAEDEAQAARWFRAGAEGGNPVAQTRFGMMLLKGRGVAKDEARAAHWLGRAAEGGDRDAMSVLGVMLSVGRGIAKDEAEAARWLQKAAEAGNVDAMVVFAAMLHDGVPVPRDPVAAARWMVKALRAGNTVAHSETRGDTRIWSTDFKRELQRLMKAEGVYSGPIDGNFGASWRAALDKLKPPKQ